MPIFSTGKMASFTSTTSVQPPSCCFGIIADVQYANIMDGLNYSQTRVRYYRNSLRLLEEAVDIWKGYSHPVSFVLQLGDVIDGYNKRFGESVSALQTVVDKFSSMQIPVHHIWGNHELYNFSREELLASPLNSSKSIPASTCDPESLTGFPPIYYDFSPVPGFRVIMLDTYDVSMLGYDQNSPQFRQAEAFLRSHNTNEDLNSPVTLHETEKHFLKYNGGISVKQLNWLSSVLRKSDTCQEKVVVAG